MIYFIHDQLSGRVKIGTAQNPWLRFSKVQSDSPGDLVLLAVEEGGREREADLHERFADMRVRGEWFSFVGSLSAYVGTLPKAERPQSARGYRNTWGASGLTDADLEALVGVSRSQLCRIRRHKATPSLPTAVKIVEHTGLPFEYFARAA